MQSRRESTTEPRGGAVATRPAPGIDLAASLERWGPRIAGSLLPFMLVLYLALRGGGYDTVVYGEVGIAAWWLVLLGALVGVLPAARITTLGWIALGLLAAFGVWTAIGISWSESAERSMTEVGRIASYLGIFALALAAQGKDGFRRTISAVAAAIAVVGGLALLSRLEPSWFAPNEIAAALPSAEGRLSYPLNYWNGVAALVAIGIPLLLVIATNARHVITRACAAAAVPVLALAAYYTFSRGGAAAIVVGFVVLLALYPRRLALLPSALTTVAGGAILIAAATQRNALEDGFGTGAAHVQGDEMLAMVIVVCGGVGLIQAALGLAAKHELGPRLSLGRTTGRALGATVVVSVVLAGVAAGLPAEVADRWDEFKDERGTRVSGAARFGSGDSTGRYQLWQSAMDANATDRLTGIGPGTFEFWEAREGVLPGFVRDAHSLYFETLAEVGVVGFALIAGMILWIMVCGVRGALSHGTPDRRAWIAGATAACATFAAAAAVDWAWELAVLPAAFLLLGAAIMGTRNTGSQEHAGSTLARRSSVPTRVLLVGGAAVALVVIAIPLATSSLLTDSQSQASANQLDPALSDAQSAAAVAPFAASPSLQKALLFESRGELAAASTAAEAATEREATNWRTWLTLSRIEARLGHAQEAVDAYRRARSLNPLSPLFKEGTP